MRRPWPTRDCCSMGKINNPQSLLSSDDIVTKYFFLVFSVMEHRWNEIDRVKPKYSEKNLSQCHFVHHKSHTHRPGIEPVPPR